MRVLQTRNDLPECSQSRMCGGRRHGLVAIDADGGWVVVVALDPADVKKKKKRACLRGWVVDADGRRVEVLLKLRVSNKKKKKNKKE